MYHAYKADRLSHTGFIWPLLVLFLLLGVFLLPYSWLPSFVFSPERAFINSTLNETLVLGSKIGVFKEFDQQSFLSLNYWGTWRFLTTVLLFANTLYLVSVLSRPQKIKFFYVLLVGAVVIATSGLIGKYIYSQGSKLWWLWQFKPGRKVVACFINANHYGVYLAFFIPFCIAFAVKSWKAGNKAYSFCWLLLYFFFFWAITVAESRGAYILAFISSIGYFFTMKGKAMKMSGVLISFVFVLLFAISASKRLGKEYQQGLNNGDQHRLHMYETVPQMVSDFPIGLGPYAYRVTSPYYLIKDYSRSKVAHHSESIPFTFLQEWGLLPFCLWCFIMFVALKLFFDYRRNGRLSKRLLAPSIIALLVAIIEAQYDFPYEIPLYCFVVSCLAGFLQAKGQKYDVGLHRKWQKKQSLLAFLLPIVTIFFVLIAMGKGELYKDKYAYAAKASVQQLAEILPQQPSSWHCWSLLGIKTISSPHYWPFTEKCFKNAAIYFPNNKDSFINLAKIRFMRGNKEGAAKAYRMWYLMQTIWLRKNKSEEAQKYMNLSEKDVESLFYIKLTNQELSREYIRSI